MGKEQVVVLVYINDMVVAAAGVQGVIEFKANLGKVFQITDLGEVKHVLGICI